MIAKPAVALMTSVGVTVLLSACSSGAAAPPAAEAAASTSASSAPQTSVASASSTSAAPVKVDPVDKAFKAKVDALCQAWLADGNKHQPPFYMGNPMALTADQLAQAGAWLDSLAVNHELVESASKLGAPATGRSRGRRCCPTSRRCRSIRRRPSLRPSHRTSTLGPPKRRRQTTHGTRFSAT